jgi:hypothetical protein
MSSFQPKEGRPRSAVETHCVRRASFRDFEVCAGSVPAGSVVATPLRSASFFAEITKRRLGDVVLRTGRWTPLIGTGGPDAGSAWIMLPLGAPGTLRQIGRAVGPGDAVVYGPGASDDRANPRDTRWALVALPVAVAETLLQPPRRSLLRRPGASAVLCADPAA